MPKIVKHALNPKTLDSLPPGKYHDGKGLSLRVDNRGNRNWVQRVKPIGRKETSKGLGTYPAISLAEARKAGAEARRRMASEPGPEPAVLTFAEVADQFAEGWTKGLKRQKCAEDWKATLRNHVYPKIGHLPVAEVDTDDVLAVLTPIWETVPKTARLARQRMEKIFDWAIFNKHREKANPATKSVTSVLPKVRRQPEHHKAMPYADVPLAMRKIAISTSQPTTRLCLQFLILTATRSGEARGADWSEIDWDTATWTVPGERAKTGRQHRIPLSHQAVNVLEDARQLVIDDGKDLRDGEWPSYGLIFPTPKGLMMNANALSYATHKLDMNAVPHGFRASFRNWCAETKVLREIAEASLGHVIGQNLAEIAYLRTDLLDSRREVMQAWGDLCAGRR